ncbi:GTP pyrophosphokinase [Amphibacillus xylanus]|uniref:GTP diphosphokinase n=1 Tax=Amphibacillus xylanus (strain ATCC 51415 / DSM 6626 / JCM 7361 / LMG 17667 / NBRC 15112 / Ep01) TaxID=698758 RepID=K0IZI9_AMPXN|nr:GTP pyrophosphokinase family protein [Amphibacillus xylanus]BAM47914.1 (p)ppGpp synthetase [Amphibacillus xylanus NBRC 15112]
MKERIDWTTFLVPYHQAVDELKVKLRGMRKQYEIEKQYSPIELVTGRVKPVASILSKAERKNIGLHEIKEKIQDIGGIRIVCQFVDDIYTIVDLLRARHDFEIIEEKDYLKEKKSSGYRSYHLIIRYPVATIHGEQFVAVEIQIRTLAMNFWAINEHSLNYKYSGEIPKDIQMRLKKAAEAAFQLDEEMAKIREEVQEAQWIFHKK